MVKSSFVVEPSILHIPFRHILRSFKTDTSAWILFLLIIVLHNLFQTLHDLVDQVGGFGNSFVDYVAHQVSTNLVIYPCKFQ